MGSEGAPDEVLSKEFIEACRRCTDRVQLGLTYCDQGHPQDEAADAACGAACELHTRVEILGALELEFESGNRFFSGGVVPSTVSERINAVERIWNAVRRAPDASAFLDQRDVGHLIRFGETDGQPLVDEIAGRVLEALLARPIPAAWLALGAAFERVFKAAWAGDDDVVAEFCTAIDPFLNRLGIRVERLHPSWNQTRAWRPPPTDIPGQVPYLLAKFEDFACLSGVAGDVAVDRCVSELEATARELESIAGTHIP